MAERGDGSGGGVGGTPASMAAVGGKGLVWDMQPRDESMCSWEIDFYSVFFDVKHLNTVGLHLDTACAWTLREFTVLALSFV